MNDAFTVGIILIFILGAVFFYFYTRLGQVEKRMKLLETILLDLKVATENSFVGFPTLRLGSSSDEIDAPDAEEVAEVSEVSDVAEVAELKDVTEVSEVTEEPEIAEEADVVTEEPEKQQQPINEFTPMSDIYIPTASEKSANTYDYMTVKELQGIAKQRGLSGVASLKRAALIDLLRNQDAAAPAPATVQDSIPEMEMSSSELFGQMAPVE